MRVSPVATLSSHADPLPMPASLALDLTDAERRTLRDARKRHDKPYVRERAAALLKIDDGWHRRKVAQKGLLQSRTPDTVYTWDHDWQDYGIAVLYIEEGRGRKPAFPPEHNSEEARAEALRLVRRTPRSMDLDRTRWTLDLLAQEMKGIGDITRGGFSKLLGRLGISYKRGLSANAKSRSRLRRKAPMEDHRRGFSAFIVGLGPELCEGRPARSVESLWPAVVAREGGTSPVN